MPNTDRKTAMRQRTKAFASTVVRLYIGLDKRREEIQILGKQMLRSGTSVAANYREASRARSDVEFIAKIELCAQEADDGARGAEMASNGHWTVRRAEARRVPSGRRSSQRKLWLELLRDDCGISSTLIDPVWQEADKLISIFVTMSKNTKERQG